MREYKDFLREKKANAVKKIPIYAPVILMITL